MLLKSLIQDQSKVTLDCAKATLEKDSVIDIADIHWKSVEVQNAIKLKFCEVVGEPPIFPEEAVGIEPERVIRFRSTFGTKLCFECIKDYVDPGMYIRVPFSKIDESEIRNAIYAGWLVSEDSPSEFPTAPRERTEPVKLEELTTADIIDSPILADTNIEEIMKKPIVDKPLPEGVPAKRPSRKPQSQIKAKRIGSVGEDVINDEQNALDDLYKPSEVRMPKQPAKSKSKPAPLPIEDADGDDDYADIFSNNQPKKK